MVDSIKELASIISERFNREVDVSECEGLLVINDLCALKVGYISSVFESGEDISINEDDVEIGFLCVVHNGFYTLSQMTDAQLCAFFYDNENYFIDDVENHRFSYNYIVLHKSHVSSYLRKYKDTSSLWGGFSHEVNITSHKKCIDSICVRDNLLIPTNLHREGLVRCVSAANGFDRYLKYYHQIELLYDFVFVRKIKNMSDDLKDFSKNYREYQRDDIGALKNIVNNYVDDISKLESVLNNAFQFESTVIPLCQDFGKDSNPLKESDRWGKFWRLVERQSLSKVNAEADRLVSSSRPYRNFILDVVTYWIYRIRCSIAHNKIGEYIFNDQEEKFVVEIGESLLKEVISEIFSSQSFKDLVPGQ